MTPAELRSALDSDPFRPFRLHLGRGKAIDVTDPALVTIGETGRVAFAFRPASDKFDIVEIQSVERLEFHSGLGHHGTEGPRGR